MMVRGSKRSALIGALIVAAVAAACDKAQLLAPSESTISVSAPATSLPLGGSTEISAFVVEQAGTPVHNGTTVRFTTSLGTVNPVEAQTRNGVATTTFSAGNASGTARITATSGSATTETPVEITVGAAAAGAVQLTATPATVPATGGTVTIVASATDASGNRLVGVPVTFSTTAGSLSASSATTDANGEARVQLTTAQAATVTARVGAQTATANVAIGNPAAATLAATGAPAGQPSTLTITPTAGPLSSVTVDWGDGTNQSLGLVAGARTVTHVYNSPGVYPIIVAGTGQLGDPLSTSTTVTVGARPSPTVTVAPATGTTATTFTFTVTPAPNSSPTSIRIDFGDGTSENLPVGSTQSFASHRYALPGTYVARVTQTDNNGASSTGSSAPITVTLAP